VEGVATEGAPGQLITPRKLTLFGASNDVARLELATRQSRLWSAGRRRRARRRNAGLVDEASLAPASKGYVALSMQLGILTAKSTPAGPAFDPAGNVTRLDGARAATAMIATRAALR